jgi:hypothetical protein
MRSNSGCRVVCWVASCMLGVVVGTLPARAQTVAADPKARYDREIARCNRGTLPAPAREACVRQAGQAFDRATGGITGTRPTISPDGRATVMEPSTGSSNPGNAQPAGPAPSLVTTPDGRATVVNPSAP